MTSARHPLPTDIVALVSFDGDIYPNEAKPLERLGAQGDVRPLENALEQWFSFATGKHTWVSVRGATIRGLISARKRAKRSAWEVEVMINTTDDASIAETLFVQMLGGIGRQGAERVFLRLEADNPLKQAARKAGFFSYADETLFRRPALQPPSQVDLPLRKKTKADTLGLFQLYNREVPANVRAVEGMTLKEWQASQEAWGGKHSDYVIEQDGVIEGWLRVMTGDVSRITALGTGSYDDLISAGLQLLGEREAFCLAPDYAPGLAAAFERHDFEPVGAYTSLAKRLTQRVGELAPETANDAIPVGQ
ncbi:MAG TPA: hypothetical protein VMR52_00350 [Dehalococcoidia bacterium]|nr:hypothetical protein [Dehalococcoidia bacterium]